MKHSISHLSSFGIIFMLLFTMTIFSCSGEVSSDEDEFQIMTVTGPISASELGTTLAHEHVLVDWIEADGPDSYRDHRRQIRRDQPDAALF